MTDGAPSRESTQHTPIEPLSPNEALAHDVVVALNEAGLLIDACVEKAIEKIRSGKVSPSDWRRWAEDLIHDGEEEGAGDADYTDQT